MAPLSMLPPCSRRTLWLRCGVLTVAWGLLAPLPLVTSRVTRAVRAQRSGRDRLDRTAGRVLAAKGYGPARSACLLTR